MRRSLLCLLLFPLISFSQTVQERLAERMSAMRNLASMEHASIGLYVVNTQTGEAVYDLNGNLGLAPASTQKLFTAAAAFTLLGPDFHYVTPVAISGRVENGRLNGNLFIIGSGDPSFGSWRFINTKRKAVTDRIGAILGGRGIREISRDIIFKDDLFGFNGTPDGWTWDDLGNYYGAGSWGLNWNENQFDMTLQPGRNEGDPVKLLRTDPELAGTDLHNILRTGARGSGDNSVVYLPPFGRYGFVQGTVPAGKELTVSGAFPDPTPVLGNELVKSFNASGIVLRGGLVSARELLLSGKQAPLYDQVIDSFVSPHLDSLVYWFLRKSINFYGETFIKTMAWQQGMEPSTSNGAKLVRDFWTAQGIGRSAIKILDGSGLSRMNRVTPRSEVAVLQYSLKQPWYPAFFQALPIYNGIHMKSGTVNSVKCFAGYQGIYAFSFMLNDYDGSSDAAVKEMYKVLEELKR